MVGLILNLISGGLFTIAFTFVQDSPPSRLLFARDVTKYKKWVGKYYKDVRDMPPVLTRDMQDATLELSMVSICCGPPIDGLPHQRPSLLYGQKIKGRTVFSLY